MAIRATAIRITAISSPRARTWGALLIVYLGWGSTYLAIRVGVRDLPPALLAGSRYLLAGALLHPVALRTGDAATRSSDRPGVREWLGCAVVGVLLLTLGNGGLTLGEHTVPSGLAAVLVATVPLWIAVFAVPVRHQRISLSAAAAMLLGLVGVGVLAGGATLSGHLAGAAVIVAASASWGFGSVLSHRLRLPRRALLAAAMEMLVGGAVLLAVAALTGEFADVHMSTVRGTSWWALVWLVVPGSVVAFSAYGYALAHLPLPVVSTYAYVNPVVAVVLGVLLLGESFSAREAVGALLVVVAVAATLHRPARHAVVADVDGTAPARPETTARSSPSDRAHGHGGRVPHGTSEP